MTVQVCPTAVRSPSFGVGFFFIPKQMPIPYVEPMFLKSNVATEKRIYSKTIAKFSFENCGLRPHEIKILIAGYYDYNPRKTKAFI